jgi:hypothetical protein
LDVLLYMMLHWKLAVPIIGAPFLLLAFGYSNVEVNQDLSLDEEDPGELQGEVVSVSANAQLARPVMRSEGNTDTTKQDEQSGNAASEARCIRTGGCKRV